MSISKMLKERGLDFQTVARRRGIEGSSMNRKVHGKRAWKIAELVESIHPELDDGEVSLAEVIAEAAGDYSCVVTEEPTTADLLASVAIVSLIGFPVYQEIVQRLTGGSLDTQSHGRSAAPRRNAGGDSAGGDGQN